MALGAWSKGSICAASGVAELLEHDIEPLLHQTDNRTQNLRCRHAVRRNLCGVYLRERGTDCLLGLHKGPAAAFGAHRLVTPNTVADHESAAHKAARGHDPAVAAAWQLASAGPIAPGLPAFTRHGRSSIALPPGSGAATSATAPIFGQTRGIRPRLTYATTPFRIKRYGRDGSATWVSWV